MNEYNRIYYIHIHKIIIFPKFSSDGSRVHAYNAFNP